jgi:hypothetical protein
MCQRTKYSTIIGLPHSWNDIDCIASRDKRVISIFTRHPEGNGLQHRQSAMLQLTIQDARHLQCLLAHAIEAAESAEDPRQTSLWSPATARALTALQHLQAKAESA